ncbi:MAG: globin [Corynebacterium sp.]|nr:globin [Corynebacterium sp.]
MTYLPDPSQPQQPSSLYEIVGEDVFQRLIHEFYVRMRSDDLIGPMYPDDDWEGAEERLRWFLIQYWGGPAEFSARRGHPRLRMRHARFAITPEAAKRWVEIMNAAMETFEETALPPVARSAIREHAQRVAHMLINQPE